MIEQVKIDIYDCINQELQTAINQAKIALNNTIESKNNETKSTVGDKYETGRAMLQMEQKQNEIQLNKLVELKSQLEQINYNQHSNKAKIGSLVLTNIGNFFISIPYGKITLNNIDYHIISLASPIGQVLYNLEQGSAVLFRNKEIQVVIVL